MKFQQMFWSRATDVLQINRASSFFQTTENDELTSEAARVLRLSNFYREVKL